jgi:hypothetical protein
MTLDDQVEHPPWRIQHASDAHLKYAAALLYGDRLYDSLERAPSSAFLAEGSAVAVLPGVRLGQ